MPAGMHNRKVYEQLLSVLSNVMLCTPVKKQKGEVILDSAERLLLWAVSNVRQPIESFFNWLEEKTNIQIANKVRSFSGLMVQVSGRMAAVCFMLVSKFSA